MCHGYGGSVPITGSSILSMPLIAQSEYSCLQVSMEDWHGFYKPLWLAAALLNSSYSYYWDIERDWDIQWFTAPGAPPKDMSTCTCG